MAKECSRVSEFLSIIQSGASSQIKGEHTTIELSSEFSDVDLIIDVVDVKFVRSYQAPNSSQISVQSTKASITNSMEDGQMILTSMSFRIPTFSGPDWKTQVGAIPNSTQLRFLEYKHIADFDGFFKVQYLGNVFYVHRNHVVNDSIYFRCIK